MKVTSVFLATAIIILSSCNSGSSPEWNSLLSEIRTKFPNVTQLQTTELASWLQDYDRIQPLIIDVRELAEYQVSHLQNAQQMDPSADPLIIFREKALDQPIVMYCSVGYRSSRSAAILIAAGYTHVFNLEGSIFKWANENHPVFKGQKRAQRVHPYSKKWGKLLTEKFRAEI